jgi:hypothetical protein
MFKKIKQAFERAVTSLDAHSEIVRAQSEALRVQTELVRALIPEVKASIAAVEKHVKYLADSERRGLQRSGQPHEF